MSSAECKEIEKEINSILREIASHKNDDSSAVSTFPFQEKREKDFPTTNASPYKYERKQNSYLPRAPSRTFNAGQEGRMLQMHRKPIKRTDDDFYPREQHRYHEPHVRKRDHTLKQKPPRIEANRNFHRKKQLTDRKLSEDKLELDSSNVYSVNTSRKNKDIKVFTAEDMEGERNISSDSSRKFKSFNYSNREKKKKADYQKAIDDKKIQAYIFANALTKASSIGESVTRRDKAKKLIEDKEFCEPKGTVFSCKDEIPVVAQCSAEFHMGTDLNDQTRIITNSGKKADNQSHMLSLRDTVTIEDEKHVVKSGDEFITRCNKKSCDCSEDSLYCTLCDFHMSNQRELERHKKQVTHQARRNDYFRIKSLEALPPPSLAKLEAIEQLVLLVYLDHVHGNEDDKQRNRVIKELRDSLIPELEEGCEFHLFGSSVNGFGHKSSNINIDLEVSQGISPSNMLLRTLDALKDQENKYGNIASDFSATFPLISFIDRRTNLPCEITLNNDASRKTSILLKQYALFDDRVRKLGTVFRIWAKVCGVDQQEFCCLPPHCFPLMTIHFLQQVEPPVLPVLHELTDEDSVLNCDMRNSWISKNRQTVAELWIELLKFYAITFQYKMYVVSIRQKEPLSCKNKKWTTRMMCIEDPYHTRRNLARTIANLDWFHYIVECIRCTYEYFCTCRLPQGRLLSEADNYSNDDDESSLSIEDNSVDIFFEDQDKDLDVDSVVTSIKAMDLGSRAGFCHGNDNRATYDQYRDIECVKTVNTPTEKKHCANLLRNPQTWENSSDTKECFVYKFEKSQLINNVKAPVLFCRQCQKLGHVKKNCSIDDRLPELKKLPKMEKDHKDTLTEVCYNVYSFCSITQENIDQNKLLLSDLQKQIQYIFKDAQLELFGSSCNGFGFNDSDLDICLTFHNKSGEDLDQKSIIEQLTRELNKHKRIQNIVPIPTAKVPIIKFSFSGKKEGDISLYNTLGQHNTRLLSTYCKIDSRVQLLGYCLKFFAKKCDICDASRGSLSSYAYILMAIFYLQQLEIPVIPVLQELYDKTKIIPKQYVDNWNTWFYEDLKYLPNVWQDYGKNKQCLGELWMGLLIFYTEKFKMTDYVISIRQKAPLTRFEKLWNTRSIAIEDPFDLSHNLGAGVSPNMNTFILAAFRRGRELFGLTPPARRDIDNLLEYFFNSNLLTGGEKPPNDRGCRNCFKIGHKVKECPEKKEKYKRRHNFEKRNSSKAYQKNGNFENRNHFTDRNRSDRHGTINARGTFRPHWNFHNHQDQQDIKRTFPNSRANTQSC